MVSASLSGDDLNYTKRAIIQVGCPNPLASNPRRQREIISLKLRYITRQIIVQSFISFHFPRVGYSSWKDPGHSVIRENLLLYLKAGKIC